MDKLCFITFTGDASVDDNKESEKEKSQNVRLLLWEMERTVKIWQFELSDEFIPFVFSPNRKQQKKKTK